MFEKDTEQNARRFSSSQELHSTSTSLDEKLEYLENLKSKTVREYNNTITKVEKVHFNFEEALRIEYMEARRTLDEHKSKIELFKDQLEREMENVLKIVDESQQSLLATQSNKQQQTTGYINVDEMCKKNELPPSLPPRPSCNRGHTGQFKQPCPLPRSKLPRKSKDMAMDLHFPSNVVFQSQPTNDGMHREQQCTDTTVPNKQFPEKQRIDNINDTSNLQKPSPLQRTPRPIHTGIVMKGNPSYEVSFFKQDAVATEESDNDTLYETIEDINKTTLVPVINPQNEPNKVYEDVTIGSSRSPNIITNGCLAETPGESIDLYDVCVNPQGWLIFSDPTNCCLRILMDTTKSSERMTKRLKDEIQPWAVTYDSSNQRIIFATTSGLSQLQLGDTKLKKLKEKKLLKGISPQFISCTTTSNKEERMHVYATILPRGRERSIQCYDENGDFCRELEVAKMPCGIDYCQEYLVVATLQDGCLAKITPYGQSLWSNEVDAQKPGILQHPFGVVILPNEYIAVTESSAHRISIFSSEGKLVLRFGSRGSEPGMFDTPRGIAVRHSKELVVIDSGNNRIQIFFLDSILETFLCTWRKRCYITSY